MSSSVGENDVPTDGGNQDVVDEDGTGTGTGPGTGADSDDIVAGDESGTLSPTIIQGINFTIPPEGFDGNITLVPAGFEWPPDPEQVTVWLVEERQNATAPCPLGFVCEENRMANCTRIRAVSLAYGFGDVHAGGFCPEGFDNLQLCPVGHFCPTADVILECPDSFFCPHKTAVPEVSCRGCLPGEETLVREPYGYLLILLILLLFGVYILFTAFRKYQADLYGRFVDLSSRSLDSARSLYRRKQRIEELERLRPKLFAIHQRMVQLEKQRSGSSDTLSGSDVSNGERLSLGELNQTSSITPPKGVGLSIDQDSGRIIYEASRLFDALDQDGNGSLDFDELQTVLQLNPSQLQAFVQRMNALGGAAVSATEVRRAVFTKWFLQVLEETSNLGPNIVEVELMFDEIAKGSDVAAYQDFFDSRLTLFLSDPQINELIAQLRKCAVQEEKVVQMKRVSLSPGTNFQQNNQAALDEENSGIDHGVKDLRRASNGLRNRNPGAPSRRSFANSRRFSMGTLFAGTDTKRCVHHDVFVKYYADVLAQITSKKDQEHTSERQESAFSHDETAKLGIDLAFENLSLAVPVGDKKVNVVNDVSGRLPARTMTALMGGSGAGKTSLLNALCGRAFYGETTGTIRINGHVASIEEHKDATGFVPQDDIVHAELTVRENLIYSGKFTLPKGTTLVEIEDLADVVLANLGLSRVADSIVGDVNRRGVSGGEKKRVNIGIELMSRPSMLFLDEPTSGLDASSALLVMGSLKNLTETQGVTVLSVIHQPRKAIFDSFDSLILLGVGGNMVYHGPVDEAQSYLANLPQPYILPPGESLADWLIDVSSGRLTPNDDTIDRASNDEVLLSTRPSAVLPAVGPCDESAGMFSSVLPNGMKKLEMQPLVGRKELFEGKDEGLSTQGPSTAKFEHSIEVAMERRQVLYDSWVKHYNGLTGGNKERYVPPAPYALPVPVEKPVFWTQLRGQFQRNLLMTWRNRASKMVDTFMIVAAVVLISWLQGVTVVTRPQQPGLTFDQLVEGDPYEIPKTFPELFKYALGPTTVAIEFALKIGVITSVLLGLTASKALTGKRLEFFRESSSGWDINAYFLALNITSTIEHFCQMILAAGSSYWLRDSLTPWYSYQVQFIMLMWITVSWSLLIPMVVPASNTTLAVGFFMAFFGLLFSGGINPVTYRDIYEEGNHAMALFSGMASVTRYFIEGLTVAEQRCLPPQSGFTVHPSAMNFPVDLVGSFHLAGLAQNDLSVVQRSCNGWYWGVYPALAVGLSLRLLAAGVLHVSDRSKQAKKSLLFDLKRQPLMTNPTFRVLVLFLLFIFAMFALSGWLILQPMGNTGVGESPETEEEALLLVNSTIQEIFPGAQATDLLPGDATAFNASEFGL